MIKLKFFYSLNAINRIKESLFFQRPLHFAHNPRYQEQTPRTIIEPLLSNIKILSFSFLFRTLENSLRLLHLIMVLPPLTRWQSSILFESQTTSISPKMPQKVDWKFLPLPQDCIPTSKHSLLLYCSWLWKPSQVK